MSVFWCFDEYYNFGQLVCSRFHKMYLLLAYTSLKQQMNLLQSYRENLHPISN